MKINKTKRIALKWWVIATLLIAFGLVMLLGSPFGIIRAGDEFKLRDLGGPLTAIAIGLALFGWILVSKLRKSSVSVDAEGVTLHRPGGKGWTIRKADIVRVRLQRVLLSTGRDWGEIYSYEMKIELAPNSVAVKNADVKVTSVGPVQTLDERFTEAEARQLQAALHSTLGVEVTAYRVPPQHRGGAAPRLIPEAAQSTGARPARSTVVFPAGVRLLGIFVVHSSKRKPQTAGRLAGLSGIVAVSAFIGAWMVPGDLLKSFSPYTYFLAACVLGVLVPWLCFLSDARSRADTNIEPSLTVDARGLSWRCFPQAKGELRHRLPDKLQLQWSEIGTIKVTSYRDTGSSHPVHTVEITPGDPGFAKRHPEMKGRWEGSLTGKAQKVPKHPGTYRLEVPFSPAATRKLHDAVATHQPGLMQQENLSITPSFS